MKIASANEGVTKILITTWTNKFFFWYSNRKQRLDSCKREKNIGSGKKRSRERD
jgi:hypothetical protein